MKTRKLGKLGLNVAAIGLGCRGLTQAAGSRDDAEAAATIDRAIAAGCNFFDTAAAYDPQGNEDLLGRCLLGRRDRVVIATTVRGVNDDPPQHPVSWLDSHPAQIRRSVERSLKRLRTDHIDLLYPHHAEPRVPIEDVAGAVGDLIADGKVLYFGLSDADPDNIRRAHAVQPVSAVRAEYSLWDRGLEDLVMPLLFDLGIGLVPRSPLGRECSHLQGDQFDANRLIFDVVREIAVAHDALPAQIALAWVLGVNRRVVPVQDSKERYYLEEILASAELELTQTEIEILDDISAPRPVSGARTDEQSVALLDP